MADIVVFGIMVADMVARVHEFPLDGETILGQEINVYLGGKGINQCVAIRRLGGEVAMVGCLGDDGHGAMFTKLMDDEGIDRTHVYTSNHLPTGIAQIQINDAGQNKIVVIPSANHAFTSAQLDLAKPMIDGARYAVFQLEMPFELTRQAISYAHTKGLTVIFNPAPAMALPSDMLTMVDYLTPNEVELGIIAQEDTSTMEGIHRAAQKLLDLGVKNIVATLGGEGALIANSDGIQVVKSFRVSNVVDTVAAGDSFNGALAVKLSEGATLAEAVTFANAMGALTVQEKGAIPSLHKRAQVDAFLAEHT